MEVLDMKNTMLEDLKRKIGWELYCFGSICPFSQEIPIELVNNIKKSKEIMNVSNL